jgi:hypothetical protein
VISDNKSKGFFFEKKEAKNFYVLAVLAPGCRFKQLLRDERGKQKFFGPFFQKRTACSARIGQL